MAKKFTDEKLALLGKKNEKKCLDAFYAKYRTYAHSIVDMILKKSCFYNSLKEEKDAIFIDSIQECVKDYEPGKGKFKSLLNAIISHKTYKLISNFAKDPLSDYVSIDSDSLNGDMMYADISSDISAFSSPKMFFEVQESKSKISNSYRPNDKKIAKLIELKNAGFSYVEIAKIKGMSAAAVRQVFYRIRKSVYKKKIIDG